MFQSFMDPFDEISMKMAEVNQENCGIKVYPGAIHPTNYPAIQLHIILKLIHIISDWNHAKNIYFIRKDDAEL